MIVNFQTNDSTKPSGIHSRPVTRYRLYKLSAVASCLVHRFRSGKLRSARHDFVFATWKGWSSRWLHSTRAKTGTDHGAMDRNDPAGHLLLDKNAQVYHQVIPQINAAA